MASWKIVVVAVFLGSVVSGDPDKFDNDNTVEYYTEPKPLFFSDMPLPIPVDLQPEFAHFRNIGRSRPMRPVNFPHFGFPTPPPFHHFRHHPIHHHVRPVFEPFVFPDAQTVMDEQADDNADFGGFVVRSSSGTDNDGTTVLTNSNGDVNSATSARNAHNLRRPIKVPVMKNTAGPHHTSFSKSSHSSSSNINGVKSSSSNSNTMSDNDGEVEAEATGMHKVSLDSDDNDDWTKIRKPTPPVMLDLDFPEDLGVSAANVLDAKPKHGRKVSGMAVRKSNDLKGNTGTTMVTNSNGDVESGHSGTIRHNLRQPIKIPKLQTGPGTHFASYSTSSSKKSNIVNGVEVSVAHSSTKANDNGKVDEEEVLLKEGGAVADAEAPKPEEKPQDDNFADVADED